MRPEPFVAASSALARHHPDCLGAFVAGSVMRGEGTATSDIDIVVLYGDDFEDVHRASLMHEGWPIEFFVQHVEAQRYFFEKDRQRGMCVLADMVATGTMLPESTKLLEQQKNEARQIIEAGPPPLTPEDTDRRRYAITNLIDDVVGSTNIPVTNAVLAELHDALADFYLRTHGRWSGHGKSVLRSLRDADEPLYDRFVHAFDRGFATDVDPIRKLVDELLAPEGGRLWEGYAERAHPGWLTDPLNA
ncbi:MAG: nucleotidyltransferase domain-containing protein [Pseudomonadota bacterium]